MTDTELRGVLEEAQDRGFLGPQSVRLQVAHAMAFAEVVAEVSDVFESPTSDHSNDVGSSEPLAQDASPLVVDLGSGGGLPALAIAVHLPSAKLLLVEGSTRRAAWLTEAVHELGLSDRATVVGERAELAGRAAQWRGRAVAVTARSFARPAVTAECAAPFLRRSGKLIVSEPPTGGDSAGATTSGGRERWSTEGLNVLGLGSAEPIAHAGVHFVVVTQLEACPDRYPRRVGIPAKRPLF